MNVFWLDDDPRQAARYHCDQHVNKMLLEAAQILSTAARTNGYETEFLYEATHANHPLVEWAAASSANWRRLYDHARALNEEFVERYGHDDPHASWEMLRRIDPDEIRFPNDEPTEPPQSMPEEYKIPGDTVAAYRTYYANDKWDWAEWKYTPEPAWLPEYRRGPPPVQPADEDA